MKASLHRLLFTLLCTTTMVIFSEKVFWYVQGYSISELVLYYSFPVYACLWTIEQFHVRTLAALVLIAAMYGFLVEGVLTPVLYEAGLFDPVMPAFFVGWHGLLSMVFGWFFLHKWLVEGQWIRILLTGTLVGLFWGVWSLVYWLPESIAEFELLRSQGEAFIPGAWAPIDYTLYVFVFTLLLAAAHWILGRIWLPSFRPGRWELGILGLALTGLFGITVIPVAPLGYFKLGALLCSVFLALRVNKRIEERESLLNDLTGMVPPRYTIALLVIPLMATLVYTAAMALQPADSTLRIIYNLFPPLQALVGGVAFIWAIVVTIRGGVSRKNLSKFGSEQCRPTDQSPLHSIPRDSE